MLIAVGMSLPGLAFLLILVVALERFGLWFTRSSWLPWRRNRTGMPISAAGLTVLDAALSPAKEVELAQQRTEFMLREDHEEGAPPRTTVDLDAGVASIYLPDHNP